MNANPLGQPLKLLNSPNAKLAVFLNSDGVAMGRAMITARHNLIGRRLQTPAQAEAQKGGLQDVQDDIDALQSSQNHSAKATSYRLCDHNRTIDAARST